MNRGLETNDTALIIFTKLTLKVALSLPVWKKFYNFCSVPISNIKFLRTSSGFRSSSLLCTELSQRNENVDFYIFQSKYPKHTPLPPLYKENFHFFEIYRSFVNLIKVRLLAYVVVSLQWGPS